MIDDLMIPNGSLLRLRPCDKDWRTEKQKRDYLAAIFAQHRREKERNQRNGR